MNTPLVQPHPSIDAVAIARLVQQFYGRAREDDLLGPIFAEAVQDWDHHISRISTFWTALVLKTGSYDGRPFPPHLPLKLQGQHFDRWLHLFEKTVDEIFPGDAGAIFKDRARRIADSFELAIATHAGKITVPRHVRRGNGEI